MKKLLILGILLIASVGCGEIDVKENTTPKTYTTTSTSVNMSYRSGSNKFNINSNNASANEEIKDTREVTIKAENSIERNSKIGIQIETNDFKNANVQLILTVKRNGEIFETNEFLDLLKKVDVDGQKGFDITKRDGALPIYNYKGVDAPINDTWEFTITLIHSGEQLVDKNFVAEIEFM